MRNETQVLFVDAARYWNRGAYTVSVVDAHDTLVNGATVVTNFTHGSRRNGHCGGPSKLHGSLYHLLGLQNSYKNFFGGPRLFEGRYGCQ
ncbi:hypothetical protein MTO96_022400 [Rhipicephalus appendiculatus]